MPKKRTYVMESQGGTVIRDAQYRLKSERYLVPWERGKSECRAAYLFGWQEVMLNDDCPFHPDVDVQPKIVQEWYENGRLDAANVKYYAAQRNMTVPFWGTMSKRPDEIVHLIAYANKETGQARPPLAIL